MNMTEKTPIVIIHESNWASPKLPPKHRFDYKTEVKSDKITLTVNVMKRNLLLRFFLGHDQLIGSESHTFSRTEQVQEIANFLEANLTESLFS